MPLRDDHPDVLLTSDFGPVRGYRHDERPRRGMIRVFRVTKTSTVSERQVEQAVNADDFLKALVQRVWSAAVEWPILPPGWAILRGAGEPETDIAEDPKTKEALVRVRMHWIARYTGR